MKIKYEDLKKVNQPFCEDFKDSFDKILASGWYILGDNLRLFEKDFSEFINVKHCIGVASGLDSLTAALKALNLNKGDEVIVPSNTYIATILSILNNQLTPVLIEPNLQTYNIDHEKIEEKITNKTKAILVVHLYGKPCDMMQIDNIAKKYKLPILEDCAQAHGAAIGEQLVGSFGLFGCFSFYPSKNLGGLGDGGAITTNNTKLFNFLKAYSNYGSEKKYYNNFIGINSRLDELQAAFLLIKLKSLEKINSHKRGLAELYHTYLDERFIKPVIDSRFTEVHHIFPIRFEKRDKLKKFIRSKDIETEIHYPVPPYQQKALENLFNPNDYPISSLIHQTILSLPISYCHSKDDIMSVIKVLNKY